MRYLKFAIAFAIFAISPAIAQGQNYVEIRFGAEKPVHSSSADDPGVRANSVVGAEITYDTGWVGAVAIGRDVPGPWRFEAEYSHHRNPLGSLTGIEVINPTPPGVIAPVDDDVSGSITVDALIAMAYLDIVRTDEAKFVPYIGFGGGINWTETEMLGVTRSDTGFAVQFVLGASYRTTPSTSATIGYSMFFFEDTLIGNAEYDHSSQSLAAGLRFGF